MLSATVSDPEGDALTYSWSRDTNGLQDGTLTNGTTATLTFTAGQTPGEVFLSLLVVDARTATSARDVIITVTAEPPPTAHAGPDQTVGEGDTVTLNGSGTDPENQPLTYLWTQPAGPGCKP